MKNARRILFIIISFAANVIVFAGAVYYLCTGIERAGRERFNDLNNKLDQVSETVDDFVLYGDFYFLHEYGCMVEDTFDLICYDKETGRYNMDGLADNMLYRTYGNLTGLGSIPTEGLIYNELIMALTMNHFFEIYYNRHEDVTWLYYISKNDFILLYPFVDSSLFSYNKSLLEMDFYSRLTPENNPGRDMIWTSVYEDEAGKGYMVTLSGPVYNEDEFLGVVCADVTKDVLDQLLTCKYACYLVDSENSIIASNQGTTSGKYRNKLSDDRTISAHNSEKISGIEDDSIELAGLNFVYRHAVEGTPWSVVLVVSAFRVFGMAILLTLPAVSISTLLFVSYREAESRKQTEEKLQSVIINDELTGLRNRYFLDSMIDHEITGADRYDRPFSMIIFDLDHFKRVNDTYGHPVGDSVLKQTAELVGKVLRKSDLFIRLGGEEFLILLPDTDMEGARSTAEKVRKVLETRMHPVAGKCTASFGVAERKKNESYESVYKKVDEALYFAKENGRNKVICYNENEYIPRMFMKIEWNEAWNCKEEDIDAQHHDIVFLANRLFNLALEETNREQLLEMAKNLLKHIRLHFEYEEEILQKIGFPLYEEHKASHSEMLDKAVHLLDQYEKNEINIFKLLPYIAHNMILLHTVEEDMKYFPYIKAANKANEQ